MSELKGKTTKSPSPFDMSAHKTERTGVAILMYWMREIIDKNTLDLGMPDVETSGGDRKMPDAVVYESRRSKKILCVIEAKLPYYDVFDEKELKEPARKKATQRKAKYFALTNFKRLIWFNTEKVNSLRPEEEQIVEKYSLSGLEDLNDIEQTRYSEPTKKGLEEFITKLYSVHSGKEPEPKQAIDEFLIFRLQEKIRVLSTYYRRIIDDQCHKDSSFAKRLTKWFVDQGWIFAWQPLDFDKAARQTAYLLVNKILFYNLLQTKRPHELDPLEIPEGLTKGSMLQANLLAYFDEALKIDYETIYTTDFIDTIAFPEAAKEVVKEIKELVNILKEYDFSTLGYDVIGRIFERLIPQEERHNLGQYFTSPDVVDLILRFCLHHEEDKILDPACGAGTFLVRAYQHKKLMNQRLEHEKNLETLWGSDIAKFPAHLATINLAINDLGVDKNYPNILQEDFFALLVGDEGFDPEKQRYVGAKWGKYLRAPEIFFKILRKGKSKLVPLKEVAEVRFGIKTGANEFFYLTEEEVKRRKIEKDFWMHKDEKENWVPNKVIVSPREGKKVIIEPEDLTKVILFINKNKDYLKGKKVLAYINYGERQKFDKRSTCASRNNWYELEFREPWPILYPMIHKDRQLVVSNKYKVQVDHNLFEIKPKRKRDILPLLCFLLSTISMLFKEFFGRTYGGGTGPVKTEGIDVERLLVIKEFSKETLNRLKKLIKRYPNPEIKTIFEDLRAYSSTDITLDKIRTDRRELDKIIMGEILGLTDAEQLEVYRAVVDLVKSRIEKAKSVKNKKTIGGINIENLKNAVIDRINGEV